MNLTELENTLITHRYKGIPGGTTPFTLRDIALHGWNVLRQDLPLPLALLKQSAHNSRWMRAFAKATGISFAPHGKTTMSPQLFQQQLNDGAWGITAATVSQMQIYRDFGCQRILMANQLIGKQARCWFTHPTLMVFPLLCDICRHSDCASSSFTRGRRSIML